MIEKTVRLCGRLRPDGIKTDPGNIKAISVESGADLVTVTVPICKTEAVLQGESRNLFLIPLDKNWGCGQPWKDALKSPGLTMGAQQGDDYLAEISFDIPFHPDWLKSSIKSTIDGVVYILARPTGLSGNIDDTTVLKPNWRCAANVQIRLPAAANTDFIWIEHEYEFGGVLNSLVTPLPPGTTTTTTSTTSTTTTTTSGGGGTTGGTTASTTTTSGGGWNNNGNPDIVEEVSMTITYRKPNEGEGPFWIYSPPLPDDYYVYLEEGRRLLYYTRDAGQGVPPTDTYNSEGQLVSQSWPVTRKKYVQLQIQWS